jgi:hypothetical protein
MPLILLRSPSLSRTGAPCFFAVFAVFAGNYQRATSRSPQKSSIIPEVGDQRTADDSGASEFC